MCSPEIAVSRSTTCHDAADRYLSPLHRHGECDLAALQQAVLQVGVGEKRTTFFKRNLKLFALAKKPRQSSISLANFCLQKSILGPEKCMRDLRQASATQTAI